MLYLHASTLLGALALSGFLGSTLMATMGLAAAYHILLALLELSGSRTTLLLSGLNINRSIRCTSNNSSYMFVNEFAVSTLKGLSLSTFDLNSFRSRVHLFTICCPCQPSSEQIFSSTRTATFLCRMSCSFSCSFWFAISTVSILYLAEARLPSV